MKFLKVVMALSFLVGCAKSGDKPTVKPFAAAKTATNDTVEKEEKILDHKSNECPQNIEGNYEHKLKSGSAVRIRFVKSKDKKEKEKEKESKLIVKWVVETSPELATSIPVDGKKHVISGRSTKNTERFVIVACQDGRIVSIHNNETDIIKSQYIFNETGFKLDILEPTDKVSSRAFKKMFP